MSRLDESPQRDIVECVDDQVPKVDHFRRLATVLTNLQDEPKGPNYQSFQP